MRLHELVDGFNHDNKSQVKKDNWSCHNIIWNVVTKILYLEV